MAASTLGFFVVTGVRLTSFSALWGSKDIISAYGQAKWLATSPWSNTYEGLGYPWAQDWSHFPVLDPVTRLEITALVSVLEPVVAVNVLYVLSFPAVAATMYVALRLLLVSRFLAFAGAVSLALLGVHFDSENPYLYNYWLVPVGLVWLASLAGAPSVMRPAQRPALALWVGLVSGAFVGLQNPQMATFFIILGTVAFMLNLRPAQTGLAVRRRLLIFGIAPVALAVAVLVGRLSRTIPATFDSSARTVEDSYAWGGKFISLLEISGGSWLSGNPLNQRMTEALSTTTWTGATAQQNAAVVVATVFVLFGGIWGIMAPRSRHRGSRSAFDRVRLWISTWYTGLLFFVTTGMGVVFAALVSPQVRGWYRLSVPLAALALTGALVFLTHLQRRLRSRRASPRKRWLSVVLTVTVAVLVLDAFSQSHPIAPDSRTRESLSGLIRTGEQALGPDCPVLSIPLVDFPEAVPRGTMEAYDHLLPFLESSTWAFSYGAIKGQLGSRWTDHLAIDPAAQAAQAKELGFCAVLVDEQGLEVGLPSLAQFAEALGPPVASAAARWHLFSLQDVEPDSRAREFLSRPEVRYESGFAPPTLGEDAVAARWTTADSATLSVWNPSFQAQALVMELGVTAAVCREAQRVEVSVDGARRVSAMLAPGESALLRIPLLAPARGESVVELGTPSTRCLDDAQPVPVGVLVQDATFASTGRTETGFLWNDGFLPPEYDLSGNPLSWTAGSGFGTADLVNTRGSAASATVDIELLAPPCGSTREVTIEADGVVLAVEALAPGSTTPVTLDVPLTPYQSLALQFADPVPGCQPPGDSRELGVGVRLMGVS